MEYTIKDIVRIIGKSEQSIYKLMRKNKEFSAIVAANCREDTNSRTKFYNETVLNWLKNHYKIELVEDRVDRAKTETETAKMPETTAPPPTKPDEKGLETDLETYTAELEAKVRRQRKKIKSLKAEIERLLTEKDRLMTLLEKEQEQRQGLLVSLVAEKKEKHILLDEPKKKHWWSKK